MMTTFKAVKQCLLQKKQLLQSVEKFGKGDRNDARKIVAKTLITTIGRAIFSKSSENFSDGWSATAIPAAEAADV